MANSTVLQALRFCWEVVNGLRIPVAVVGGLALATWKHPRATRDVDLMIDVTEEQFKSLLDELQRRGARLLHGGHRLQLGETDVVRLAIELPDSFVEIPLDLLIAKTPRAKEALARSVLISSEDFGIEVRVLTCEDLIVNKVLAGRMIDLADAATLIRENLATLDMTFLKKKLGEFDALDDFARIWKEAFPDAEIP